MKKLLLLLVTLLANITVSYSQYDEEKDSAIQKHRSIETSVYVKAMNSMFKFDTLCLDDILITHINGNKVKNKYVTYSEIRTYLCKRYYKPGEKIFKQTAETNNGYVIVICQYGKDPDVAIRFFTLFIDVITQKINVIEIEENK